MSTARGTRYVALSRSDFVVSDYGVAVMSGQQAGVRTVAAVGGQGASPARARAMLPFLAQQIGLDENDDEGGGWGKLDILLLRDLVTYHMLCDDYEIAPTWSTGVFLPSHETVLAADTPTLLHELTHVAIDRRCGRGMTHRWFDEGTAMFYELDAGTSLLTEAEQTATAEDVIAYCRQIAESVGLPDLPTYLRMSPGEFYADPHANYSVAFSLVYYLRNVAPTEVRNPYRELWQGYLDADKSGPTQRLMFATVGIEERDLERDFLSWLIGQIGGEPERFEERPLDVPRDHQERQPYEGARTRPPPGVRPQLALGADGTGSTTQWRAPHVESPAGPIRCGGVPVGSMLTPVWAAVWENHGGPEGAADQLRYDPGPRDRDTLIERWAMGQYDLLFLDEPITNEEQVILELNLRRAISGGPCGRAFLAFWVKASNAVRVAGEDTLRSLWRGDIDVWSEVAGGEDILVRRGGFPINTVVGSYARQWWGPMANPAFFECISYEELDEFTDSDDGAFSWWLWEDSPPETRRALGVLRPDPENPGQSYIADPLSTDPDRRYPWEIPMYVYIFDRLEGTGRDFFSVLLNPGFQQATATDSHSVFPPFDEDAEQDPDIPD